MGRPRLYWDCNKELAQVQVANMRGRKANTKFKWVKGHSGNPLNEGADKLANEGAQKQMASKFPPNFDYPEQNLQQ
jgi:ribonuclease HI